LAEKNRVVAVFDFLLGLVELGMAYAVYQAYNAINIAYLTNSRSLSFIPFIGDFASGVIAFLLLLAIFVGLHGIKRLLENLVVFVRVAKSATKSIQSAVQNP